MKLKFENFFRAYVFVLFAILIWAVWAGAQPVPATNSATRSLAPESKASVAGARPLPLQPAGERDSLLTFGLDRLDFLQVRVFGQPLWQYVGSLIYILLAFYVSKFLDHLIHARLKKWAEKTETKVDDILLELIDGPIKVVSFVILLHIGLQVFTWPPWLADLFRKGLKLVVACSLTYVSLKFVDLLMNYWKERDRGEADRTFDEQLYPIVSKSLKVFIVVVAVLVTSQNLGLNITGVIASLSIGGLALGLAAQDTLANLFGAVAIFLDKPFRLGDRIKLDEIDGVVESIGLRSTRVRNLDGHLVTIPNKTMGNASITNITRRPNIKTEMNIGIIYDTPPDKIQRALQILDEVYRGHPMTHDVWISFNKFADSALNILVVHWWNSTDYKAYLAGMQDMNLKIKAGFDLEGIEFAFPTQTHYVRHVTVPLQPLSDSPTPKQG